MSEEETMSDEEAIIKIAQAMKDNAPDSEEKHNVHGFLHKVVQSDNIERAMRTGNLRDDDELNELGIPRWNVRGALEMARISSKLMNNKFFKEYFEAQAMETLGTSLSRNAALLGFATTKTNQVADITKRRKINKGMFGHKNIEEQGGSTIVK